MFLSKYNPSPILLNLNFIQIYWYGFLITLGACLGFLVFYKLARRADLKKDFIFELFFWLIIWGLIGGRLYHVLSEINFYISHPLKIFQIWNGGMGIYGAVLVGVLVIYYFSKKYKLNFLKILDLLIPSLALAQAIGRWGNYFNQELYGSPTSLPWKIFIASQNRVSGFENFSFFHPTFLYESLFCLILFVIFYFVILRSMSAEQAGLRRRIPLNLYNQEKGLPVRQTGILHFVQDDKSKAGSVFLFYLISYSVWRFFIEFLRIDFQPEFLNLRLSQWVSLVIIILSITFYFKLKNVGTGRDLS